MRVARWLFCLSLMVGALAASERCALAQACSVSTTSVSFGVYDVFSPVPLASTGSLSIRCFIAVPTVAVWLGRGGAPTNNPRQMSSGGNRLNYNLYLDAAHTAVWGDPNPNHLDTGWILFLFPYSHTIYGLIPADQDVPAGAYTDAVTVTINF
jgi:spore coat protein U-like protein